MRIGIVTTWFERGAAYVSRQYRRQLERQHEVFIYARGGEEQAIGDPAWDGKNVTWGRPSVVPAVMAIDLRDFRRWIEDQGIEMVLFNEQHWWDPVVLCSELGVVAGAYVDYYTRATLPLFGCYDFLVCNTRRHHSVFPWHPQTLYVPWGTDLDVFRPAMFDPVTPGVLTFFHSAGMNPVRKGTDFVLEAFSQLTGPARLVIHTQSGLAGIENLRPLAEKLQAEGRLRICDQTVSAPGLYHLGDVYVYPSRLDGIGLTVAEALACGLPVIVPDEAPMNEFVDATSGAMVPVKSRAERGDGYYWPMCFVDVDQLRIKMQAYVDGMSGLGAAKRAARTYAETHLDWMANSRDLPERLAQIKPLPAAQKKDALRMARSFERRQATKSTRYWLSYHFPQTVAVARRAYRAVRGS
jgi:glycosyltransferase involved in cell wall biosynthesis